MLVVRRKPVVLMEIFGRRSVTNYGPIARSQGIEERRLFPERRAGNERRCGEDRRKPPLPDGGLNSHGSYERRSCAERRSGYDRRDFFDL
jgi:hypothetical protein